ncbi:bacteriophage holin [archaeon]|nr:bacteriophage holin [archaeon]
MTDKINAKNLGLAGGILWGLSMFAMTIAASTIGYGRTFMETYGSLHPGYSVSIAGSAIGLVYGFVCGFVGLYIIAWLYNWFDKKK